MTLIAVRRWSLSILIGLLLVLSLVPGLNAQESGNVLAGAELMPANTLMYASIRTDDAYITQIDGILNEVIQQAFAALPADMLSQMELNISTNPLRTALDDATSELGGMEAMRAWLGGHASIGVFATDIDNPDTIVILEIVDRAAAIAVLGEEVYEGSFTSEESGDYTLLSSADDDDTFIAVSDRHALVANRAELLPVAGEPAESLANNARFQAAIGQLPGSSYNVLAYIDAQRFIEFTIESGAQDMVESPVELGELAEAIGGVAIGATILDDRHFVLDMTQQVSTESDLLPNIYGVTGPIEPAFLSNIPKDADIVLHATNLNATYLGLKEWLVSAAQMGVLEGMTEAQVNETLMQLNFLVQFATGVDLDNGIFGWMTGDYVLFIDYNPLPAGESTLLNALVTQDMSQPVNPGVDFGIVFEATDPAAAAALANGLENALNQFAAGMFPITREQIAGADAVVLTIDQPPLVPIQLVIGANDNTFVIGTRAAAETALAGSGGLNSSPAYSDASSLFLPDASAVMYLDGPGTVTLVGDLFVFLSASGPQVGNVFTDILSPLGSGGSGSAQAPTATPTPSPEELMTQYKSLQQAFRDLGGLFSSASITTTYNNGFFMQRWVISLGE